MPMRLMKGITQAVREGRSSRLRQVDDSAHEGEGMGTWCSGHCTCEDPEGESRPVCLERGRGRCWRGGQAQAAQGFGGQGRRRGTAAEVPPVTGSTDSSWPPCEVTKGTMREAERSAEASVAGRALRGISQGRAENPPAGSEEWGEVRGQRVTKASDLNSPGVVLSVEGKGQLRHRTPAQGRRGLETGPWVHPKASEGGAAGITSRGETLETVALYLPLHVEVTR